VVQAGNPRARLRDQALHRERPSNSDCIIAFKRLSRVSEIQRVLIASWGVLTTLTPDEFHVFRRTVGQNGASGFQSVQYRVLEFRLGLKYRTVTFEKPMEGGYQSIEFDVFANARTNEDRQALENALGRPSIYDAVNYYISKHLPMFGIREPPAADYAEPYRKTLPVFNAWRYVYENRENEPELYQLGEKLVDLEDAFRRWRFAHVATVSRVIGNSTGTGARPASDTCASRQQAARRPDVSRAVGCAKRNVQPDRIRPAERRLLMLWRPGSGFSPSPRLRGEGRCEGQLWIIRAIGVPSGGRRVPSSPERARGRSY
jgi:tryptophan 2,3-dioxygenase